MFSKRPLEGALKNGAENSWAPRRIQEERLREVPFDNRYYLLLLLLLAALIRRYSIIKNRSLEEAHVNP